MSINKPTLRKAEILEAAIIVAETLGFNSVRQNNVAEQAKCAIGTVNLYFGTMNQLRSAIMRTAVKRGNLKLISQGLGIQHPEAKKATDSVKKEALKLLCK